MVLDMKTPKPARVVTREDVAKAAGVSLATAALALNDHPRVAVSTKERVAEAARRLGFVANHAARRLAGMRSDARVTSFGQVGLLYFLDVHVGGEAVFLSVVGGIEEELARLSASLVLVRISESQDWSKFDRLVQSGLVDAWLLFGNVDEEALARVAATGAQYVILGDHQCASPAHAVNIDFLGAGALAAHHIATLGHRRVAYFAGSMLHGYQRKQLEGFQKGAREAGLDLDPGLVAFPRDVFPIQPKDVYSVPGDVHKAWDLYQRHQEEHPRLLSKWLIGHRGVTAIITSEFEWTSQVCAALGRLGINVPREMSVLGFEALGRSARNMLFTHISMPMQEIGRQGARLLRDCVASSAPGARVEISPALVSGSTSCPISFASTTNKD